jgi:diguanylate cyclase (GGDEF)-like protein
MTIESFVDEVDSFEIDEIRNRSLEEIIKYMQEKNIERLYVTENLYPVFMFNPTVIIDIFIKNLVMKKAGDYIDSHKNVEILDSNMHIIESYNYMRSKKLEYAAVVKDSKFIGEISFNTLSLKISFIAIKDPLTNTYNEKYFNVLIEEYNEIAGEIGIIMVKVLNLSIYEGLYGIDTVNKILINISEVLKKSIRDVDFVFRNDDLFKIITFNNAEITLKIKNRIEEKIKSLEIEKIPVHCRIVCTQVPELENNIILAVEELERKLIKRD